MLKFISKIDDFLCHTALGLLLIGIITSRVIIFLERKLKFGSKKSELGLKYQKLKQKPKQIFSTYLTPYEILIVILIIGIIFSIVITLMARKNYRLYDYERLLDFWRNYHNYIPTSKSF